MHGTVAGPTSQPPPLPCLAPATRASTSRPLPPRPGHYRPTAPAGCTARPLPTPCHHMAPSVDPSHTSAHWYKGAARRRCPSFLFPSRPPSQARYEPPPFAPSLPSIHDSRRSAAVATGTRSCCHAVLPPRWAAPSSSLTSIGPVPHLPRLLLRLQDLVAALPGKRTPPSTLTNHPPSLEWAPATSTLSGVLLLPPRCSSHLPRHTSSAGEPGPTAPPRSRCARWTRRAHRVGQAG
jgi:hypothetical protein